MPDKLQPVHRGALSAARLYVGEADAEIDVFDTPLGEVAVSTVANEQKTGPNEDSAAIVPVSDQHMVLIVADGVGGMPAARRASNLTVETIRSVLEKCVVQGNGPSEGNGQSNGNSNHLRSAILDGIEAANHAVLDLGTGAASTLALAELGPGYVRTYHVGDSIILLCGQRGRVKLQTVSHSPVGFAMEAGLLDEKEALQHAQLHMIFNVIGSADMRIEVGSRLPMAAKDTLLLASDGLADNLLQEEIVGAIRKGPLLAGISALTLKAQSRMAVPAPGQPSKPDDFTVLLYRPARTNRPLNAEPS